MNTMKRRRIPSCRLRNCCVPISNVLKRVRTTDGSESGYVNRFMPAEDLVKELLFGVGTKEDMAETERNILEHQVDAEDVIIISEDEMDMDTEERDYSSFSLASDDFQEDRTWRKPEKSQPRMPPSTVKKRSAVILPSNWQSKSKEDVQQSLQTQDGRLANVLDDVYEEDDPFPAEQRVPSLPSLPPSSLAENSRVHLPTDWQNMTLHTFKDTTSFNNNNINGISRILENIDVEEEEIGYTEVTEESERRLTRNENDVEATNGKRKKKKKSKYKDSQRIHSQSRRRKEMKKSKKQKKDKRKVEKRIVLPNGWQKKTREELYTEILSGNPVPVSQDHSREEDGGQECSSPVRKEFLPLINESPDLSLIE